MIYCDASLIMATLTNEPHTAEAIAWFADQPPRSVAISPWVMTEVASALSQKVRAKYISPDLRRSAEQAWRGLIVSHFQTLPIGPNHFDHAVRLLSRDDLGLRAGDALHVAIAAEERLAIATLDDQMIAAAAALGLVVEGIRTPT